MYLIIGLYGSRNRKILANYYFFLYTLIGSVCMLLGIVYILSQIGTTDYEILLSFSFSKFEQQFLWFAFFVSLASKIPMVPLHLWLPEAHVEAPTGGSIILAGVLLKLGSYGFIRFSLTLFPFASFFFTPLIYTIVSVSILYASFTAIRQTDFKRIIAYTSIAHMNLVVLGIFSFNNLGLEGAVFQSLSHGFVASALFLVIGIVYERYKTRLVKYYGGLVLTMPIFVFLFLFFSAANIGFPGTSSFVGEFLIFSGAFKISTVITFLSALSMVIGGGYSLWLFNRVCYGNLKTQYTHSFLDLNYREFVCFIPLFFGALISGIYPNLFLNSIHFSISALVELMYF
jgi:proton-translocating NADH-quinone oxidoreductase chain M